MNNLESAGLLLEIRPASEVRMVVCCSEMSNALDREMVVHSERHLIRDGRTFNDIDSEYFLRSGDPDSGQFRYLALNFCPFCGRPLSRALWLAEKKK